MSKPEIKTDCETTERVDTKTLTGLIPEFNTDNPSEVYKFLRSCDSTFSLAQSNQIKILITYALNKIIGVGAPDIHARQYPDWSSLRSFIIEKFADTKTLPHLQLTLQSLFQKSNESVTDYFHRVDLCRSKIIEKLHAECPDDLLLGYKASTEATALSVFVNGLNNDIGVLLRVGRFTSLSKAARFAIEEDKIRKMNLDRQKLYGQDTSKTRFLPQRSTSKPTYTQNPRQHIPNTNVTKTYTSPSHTKMCNYCKNPGHLIAECRKRAYNNSLRQQQSSTIPKQAVQHLNSQMSVEEGVSTDFPSNPSSMTEN